MQYFTDRVLLGSHPDISGLIWEPTNPPPIGGNVIENIYHITMGLDSTSKAIRFNTLELCFEGMVPDQVDVITYRSRLNPAPFEHSLQVDAADRWTSLGGQTVYRVPTAAGGNTIQVRVNGARYITWKVMNSLLVPAAIPVIVYGLPDREGGW